MKKIILGLVFVLGVTTIGSAQNSVDCYESAEIAVYMANEDSRTWYGTGWLTYEEEYYVFEEAYEECMGN